MDKVVHVLLADSPAAGFGAPISVDVVPPGAAFVMAEGLADEFAHGAALLLRDGLARLSMSGGRVTESVLVFLMVLTIFSMITGFQNKIPILISKLKWGPPQLVD